MITKTNLKGVLVVKPPTIFEDFRGNYVEIYNKKIYKSAGIHVDFIQDDISTSTKDVIRGIHGDSETWKLISCLHGRLYAVVVNCDEESSQFGQVFYCILSGENHNQILVPPKHGNAHLVLSETAIFHYKQSTYYNPETQFTYKWNEPKFNIWWPTKNPILTQRDEQGHW